MIREKGREHISETALNKAAVWKERLESGDANDELCAQFESWLSVSEENQHAWLQVKELNETLNSMRDMDEVAAFRKEVYTRVVAAGEYKRQSYKALMAACLAVVSVVSVVFWQSQNEGVLPATSEVQIASNAPSEQIFDEKLYQTSIGETMEIVLDDASVVLLDTQSSLSVNYTHQNRSINLQQGRAMFDVAKDVTRPFTVSVENRKVTALGTKFDVRSIDGQFVVNLVEGHVKVESTPNAAKPTSSIVELKPGFQAIAKTIDQEPIVASANMDQSTSWQRGLLMFNDDSLYEAVVEMNRYSATKIVLADQEISHLRLSGVFKAGDNDGFVEALTAYFSVEKLSISDEEIVISFSP